MSMLTADTRRDLPLAFLTAGTTWFTMVSWRGFADQWGAYLGPLLGVTVWVAAGGVLLRALRLPARLGIGLHVLLVAMVVWLMSGGSVLHPLASAHHIADSLHDAWFSSTTFAPPIPATVPSIAPLLIPCGALALLLVDVLACWARRVPLAGLALAGIYVVPIGLPVDGVSWLVFLGSAAGFLLMLFVQQSTHVARWGRSLAGSAASADPHGFGVSAGVSRANAAAVGAAAVVLAVILPLFVPTLHLEGPHIFGAGGGDGVSLDNPVTDLRRNLARGNNVPLLEVNTTDPDPSYLRTAVLTAFNGVEWTTGARTNVPTQSADGLLPISEQYLGRAVQTTAYPYTVTATKYFDSTWLPTEFPVTSISAPGVWQYDLGTMDFRATSPDTTTQGITYAMTAAKPRLSATSMIQSLSAPQQIQSRYTELPRQVSARVQDLAISVTRNASSRYEKMVTLQNWFRSKFRYSLKAVRTPPGDENRALDRFLSPGKGGRVGYCEQFASAFAVMARTLDIPARVAVGFLQPSRARNGDWLYRAYDMHAWPEVFFQGSGWVRFEPTPGSRAPNPPSYTDVVKKRRTRDTTNLDNHHISQATATASPQAGNNVADTPQPSATSSAFVPRVGIVLALALAGLIGALLTLPSAVRRSRRTRRLSGGAEDAWSELRDSAIDLGVSWPGGRSPHETGERLAAWFGPEPDGAPAVRPPRGRGLDPAAEAALDRIVLMVEQVRYAPSADDVPGALADDVGTCVAALEHGCTRRALNRARWLPRSVMPGAGASGVTDAREPRTGSHVGGVDRAG